MRARMTIVIVFALLAATIVTGCAPPAPGIRVRLVVLGNSGRAGQAVSHPDGYKLEAF